jgi:hypothetical protein
MAALVSLRSRDVFKICLCLNRHQTAVSLELYDPCKRLQHIRHPTVGANGIASNIDGRDNDNGTMETTYYGNAAAWYRGSGRGQARAGSLSREEARECSLEWSARGGWAPVS